MSASVRETFRGAVERILNSWTALRLAVEHGFGGSESREKAEWMVQAVDQWFSENNDIDPWELEEFLAEVLNNEFDTVADDESLPQVSQMICGCYKMLLSGNTEGVKERLARLPQPASLHKCVAKQINQEVENGDVDTGEEPPGSSDPINSMSQSTSQDSPGTAHPKGEPTYQNGNDDTNIVKAVGDLTLGNGNNKTIEADEDGWVTVGKKGKRR